MRWLTLVGTIGALWAASYAEASIIFLEQTGAMTVHGETGTFSATAPPASRWFQTINSGGGGPVWFAQSFMFSNWTAQQMTIYAEALVSSGNGPPRLTQSLAEVSIRFRLAEAMQFDILLNAAPNNAGPGVPLNEHSMRIIDAASGDAVVQGEFDGRRYLGAGEYILAGVNRMGNLPENLSLTSGARMLSIQMTVVPSPGAELVMIGGAARMLRRRRGVCG